MAEDLLSQIDLGRGERVLGHWRVEPAEEDRTTDRGGWLVLTNRRCLFFRKAGLLGGRLEKPPQLTWFIESVQSVVAQRFWMRIGYGDRMEMPGVGIDGYGFRLPRDTPPGPVVEAILGARNARRTELGFPLG